MTLSGLQQVNLPSGNNWSCLENAKKLQTATATSLEVFLCTVCSIARFLSFAMSIQAEGSAENSLLYMILLIRGEWQKCKL